MSTCTNSEPVEVRLDDATIDRLADRLAQRIVESLSNVTAAEPAAADTAESMLTAAEVAARWGVDRSWVYQHSRQLGAIRMGGGRRPRLRFDPEQVARALAEPDPGAAPTQRIVRDRPR